MRDIEKMECLEQLGKAIKEKRIEMGMTQKQVCELVGLPSQGHYSQIEAGQRDAEFVTLVKICRLLNIDLNAIIASYM